jgi:hypothetical protein
MHILAEVVTTRSDVNWQKRKRKEEAPHNSSRKEISSKS